MSLPFTPFETERLLLRFVEPEDAEALFGWYSNAEVCKYWFEPPMTQMEQAIARVERLSLSRGEGDSVALTVVLKESKVAVGSVSAFRHDEKNQRCEVGYALGRENWGKGYMSEALKALLQFGFEHWDIHRYEADTDPNNSGSIKLLTGLGFKQEGLLRERWIVAGEVSDTAFFGLLRSDWS